MIAALREHQFDTVLGPIDFDEKGDLAVQNPVWYVWRAAPTCRLKVLRHKEGGAETRSAAPSRCSWRSRWGPWTRIGDRTAAGGLLPALAGTGPGGAGHGPLTQRYGCRANPIRGHWARSPGRSSTVVVAASITAGPAMVWRGARRRSRRSALPPAAEVPAARARRRRGTVRQRRLLRWIRQRADHRHRRVDQHRLLIRHGVGVELLVAAVERRGELSRRSAPAQSMPSRPTFTSKICSP